MRRNEKKKKKKKKGTRRKGKRVEKDNGRRLDFFPGTNVAEIRDGCGEICRLVNGIKRRNAFFFSLDPIESLLSPSVAFVVAPLPVPVRTLR